MLPVALLLAAPHLSYDFLARSEGRGSSAAGSSALDRALEVDAALSLRLRSENLDLSAVYAPRALYAESHGSLDVVHSLTLAEQLGTSRDTRLTLSQRATVGNQDFGLLNAQPLDQPAVSSTGRPLASHALPYVDLEASGRLEQSLGPRLQLAAAATAQASGGATEEARLSIPLRNAGRVNLSGGFQSDRLDRVSFALDAGTAHLSNGSSSVDGNATAGYSTRLSARATAALSLGASLGKSTDANGVASPALLSPIGSATLGFSLPIRGQELIFGLRLAGTSINDRITGAIYPRGETAGDVTWAPTQSLRLSLQGGGTRVMSGTQAGEAVATLGGSATLFFTRTVGVVAGARSAYSVIPERAVGDVAGGAGWQWAGFLAFFGAAQGGL